MNIIRVNKRVHEAPDSLAVFVGGVHESSLAYDEELLLSQERNELAEEPIRQRVTTHWKSRQASTGSHKLADTSPASECSQIDQIADFQFRFFAK